ncbi:hypothetical protein LJR030_003140 [Rhizobium sp. LjRoot30]|uniref:hypothetical protein n=1 Tax=Rhizobium sp. LjRoot30 TaxID=3342320 RepID=UPI003ECCF41F
MKTASRVKTPDISAPFLPFVSRYIADKAREIPQTEASSLTAANTFFAYACVQLALKPTETIKGFEVAPRLDDGRKERILSMMQVGRSWAKFIIAGPIYREMTATEFEEHAANIVSVFWTALIAADLDFDEVETLLSILDAEMRAERKRLLPLLHRSAEIWVTSRPN